MGEACLVPTKITNLNLNKRRAGAGACPYNH